MLLYLYSIYLILFSPLELPRDYTKSTLLSILDKDKLIRRNFWGKTNLEKRQEKSWSL